MGSIDNSTEELQIVAEDDNVDNSTEERQVAGEDDDVVVVPRIQGNKRQRTESGDQSKKIFVKMTKTIVCFVKNTDTIDHIKTLVENMEGIAPINQKLFFGRVQLKGTHTVGDYNIPANSCIEMYVKDGIRISIRNSMNSLSLDVKISDTISHVKAMMRSEGGIPSDDDITLFFANKKLHDDETLGSCGVHHNAVLQMVVRRSKTMLVTVKLLSGIPIELEVQSWYSIAQLKDILGLPELMLSYCDKQLEDKKSLHHYHINDHAVLKERLM